MEIHFMDNFLCYPADKQTMAVKKQLLPEVAEIINNNV